MLYLRKWKRCHTVYSDACERLDDQLNNIRSSSNRQCSEPQSPVPVVPHVRPNHMWPQSIAGYGWVEKFRISISRSNLLWLTIPALVWYAPGCVLPHPLPSPTLVPLWRPPSYSSNHRDGDSMECNPSARIMHAECLYSWLWSSGFSSTSSPSMLVTTSRYQPFRCSSTPATTPPTTNWISSWKVHTDELTS